MELFLEHNPNPVISVGKDGTVLYSNEAGEPLLQEWGTAVGEKLPLSIADIVQKVTIQNDPEKMEVKVGNRVYLVVFHTLTEQECVNICGFDISDQKDFEGKLRESEAWEIANLELTEIIDIQVIQSLMDDFYKLTHIPIGINDLKGNVLVGTGWQDICTKFHRVHPETCKHCIESDIKLSSGVAPGEFKAYKCKNNMWDIVTPIMVGDQHVGYVFAGQFFFEDETLDYELFRSQARKYGFDEEEYIAALKKVPRLSREAVDTGMSFLMAFANMISQLSYSNLKLSQSLAERDTLVSALRESEKRERTRSDELAVVLDAVPAAVWITHDPQALQMTGNRLSYEWLHLPEGVNISKSALKNERPKTYRLFKDGVEIPLEDMPVRMSASGKEVRDYEFNLVYPDGKMLHLLGNVKPLLDEHGNPQGAVSAFIDITERRRVEEEVQGTKNMLQLVMNNIPQGIFWKDRNSRYMGCNKVFAKAIGIESPENIVGKTDYDLPWSPEQIEWFRKYDRRTMENGTPEYQIVESQREADRELAWVETNKVPLHDAKGNVIGILGTYEDITERKKAEEAIRLSNLYNRSLIETSLDPLVTIGRDGKITDVNNATEKVTGYSRNDLIGTDFSDYFTEPDKARIGYQQVFKDGEVRDYPLEIKNKEGHTTPVLYNASVYSDENGEVIGVFAAARDITERRQAEHQLSNELARATGLYELYTRSSNLSDRELYDFALNQAVKITDSTIGFFHLVSEDEKEIILTTWNQEALRSCTAGNEGHYPIEEAGNWVDCVRLKRPVVYNDFPSSPNQKGLPAGHATVKRFMSVPVTENGKVRIIFGVGNKVDKYDDRDVMQLQLVANELHKIMKLRRIENEVRESEAFLRDIMENVSDAIFVKDKEARVILANPAYYRLMGKSPEEVLNKTAADFHIPEIAKKLAEDDKQVMETGKGTTLEERIFTSHGWCIFQTVKAPYYDGQGNITGLIGTAQDITENKKAEEALKKAYDNLEKLVKERTAELEKAYNSLKESEKGLAEAQEMAHIGNWEWGLATEEAYWSDEMYRIFRRDPNKLSPPYHEFLNYIHPDDRDYVDSALALKKAVKGKTHSIEYRIVLANGKERAVHMQSEVVFDEKNTPIRTKGIIQDITERKEAGEALKNLEIVRKKEIHHRIKNNLQVISSLLDLQADKFDNPKVIEAFRESQNRVISMALIHEELYKGGGNDTLDFSTYAKELAENLFQTYSLNSKNIHLNTDLEENAFFDMDTAVPLGIIVNELVSNSLKHAFPGRDEGEIQIKLHREENGEDNKSATFVLTVSDNGVGIPENLEIEDLGSLGLQLITTLVDQLDGELELKRKNGTEFTMRFTVKKDNLAQVDLK